MESKRTSIFESSRIFRSVLRLALPTIAGQIILVLYNLADTFFIGLTEDDAKLISVTVWATPIADFVCCATALFLFVRWFYTRREKIALQDPGF